MFTVYVQVYICISFISICRYVCMYVCRYYMFIELCYFVAFTSEITFASYPASMIAAGSIMAAARGLLQREWCDAFQLVTKLQNIVSADAVILCSMYWLYLNKNEMLQHGVKPWNVR